MTYTQLNLLLANMYIIASCLVPRGSNDANTLVITGGGFLVAAIVISVFSRKDRDHD